MVKKIIRAQDILAARIDPDYFFVVISYSSPLVQSLQWDAGRESLTIDFDGSREELDRLIERIQLKIGKTLVNKPPQVVYAHQRGLALQQRNVWEELVREGLVTDLGQGHVAYRGLFLELVQRLDAAFQDIAARKKAEPVHLPNLIPVDYLKKIESFDQYPHYLFFTSPLVSDIENIEAFQSESASGRLQIRNHLADPEYCLKTAACSLLYPTLENKDFQYAAYYTTVGACTRHESKTATSFERLTEFRMREIIFVGDEAGAQEFQRWAIDLFRDLIECFDLTAKITTANDSFFVSNYSKYKLMQLLGSDKFEARLSIPDTNAEIAFASFNHHRYFFSQRFGFSFRGEPAASACLGFGLERLVYGILCQCGMERSGLLTLLDRFLDLQAARGVPSTGDPVKTE